MKYVQLIKAIDSASQQLLGRAAAAVNQALVVRNWLIGAYIIEFEQHGQDRARYGAYLLERLAADLAGRGLKGLEIRNLRNCRLLYQGYPQIRQTLSAEFHEKEIPSPCPRKSSAPEPVRLSAELLLGISWSKLIELVTIDDPWKRAFYENECLKGNWSVRQLQRQIGSLLFERTGLSKNKAAVIQRARTQATQETIEDFIRDPYVLEFTGLAELPQYTESDLETALLDHLQKFLLELGVGFCFEARQKRITVGNEHDYIDLVFYHRLLRCQVLLDLKIRPSKHGDAGQMNFYLNFYKTKIMAKGDHPPIGIVLCSDKDQTKVEFATAGLDSKLFVSRYLVAFPSAEQLAHFVERDRAVIEASVGPGTRDKATRRRGDKEK